jgi:hypothetical protein
MPSRKENLCGFFVVRDAHMPEAAQDMEIGTPDWW